MSIKIGNLDVSYFKVGGADCSIYLGDVKMYPTTPPTPSYKWLATYSDSHTESAECDSTSAITNGNINKINLVSVAIGDCVTTIGNSVFESSAFLTSTTIGNGVISIGNYAFDDCTSLTSIDIPSGVTSISVGAFRGCSSLTSIDIPNSVTSIGGSAFRDCKGLTSITVNATTPPTLGGSNAFGNTNNSPIYVPAESVETYKAASRWSTYASRIQAIPNS